MPAKSMPIRVAQGLAPGAKKPASSSGDSNYKKPSSKKKPKKEK